MNLTILGCDGGFPKPNGACSGYLLESSGEYLLIDCGSGVLPRLLSIIPLDKLSGIIITHLHYDHMSDMLPMTYLIGALSQTGSLETKIPLILPKQPSSVSSLLDNNLFDATRVDMSKKSTNSTMNALSKTPYAMGEFRVSCFKTRHAVPSFAVRATNINSTKTLSYTSDTNEVPGFSSFLRDSNLLLASTPLPHASWTDKSFHMSATIAAKLALDSNSEKLMLTHMNHNEDAANQQLAEAAAIFANITQAIPLQTYQI